MIDHPSTAWSRRHLNTLPTTGTAGRFLFLADGTSLNLSCVFQSYCQRCVNFSPVILITEKEIEGSYNQRRGANRLNHARSCIKRGSVRANRANASHHS